MTCCPGMWWTLAAFCFRHQVKRVMTNRMGRALVVCSRPPTFPPISTSWLDLTLSFRCGPVNDVLSIKSIQDKETLKAQQSRSTPFRRSRGSAISLAYVPQILTPKVWPSNIEFRQASQAQLKMRKLSILR
jgi:hypothetical protein